MDNNNNERPASGIYSARVGSIAGKETSGLPTTSLTLEDGDVWCAESFGFTDTDLFLMELKGNFVGNLILSHDEKQKDRALLYGMRTQGQV